MRAWMTFDALNSAEGALLLLVIAIGLLAPRIGASWFRRVEQTCGRLARRRGLAVLVVGLLPLVARLAVSPLVPMRQPAIADEFSYLLMADTFSAGRLTNPPHPLWVHFETFHVLMQPTYASKYPVAQGVILAAGKVIAGHPLVGVWISGALLCAAICWMLQAWLPPGWAFVGGLLAVMRLGIFSYWMNSYWGGAHAAIGGALVLGALPRILRRHRVRDALWMALGLAILANSRPLEGLALSLPVAVALLVWTARSKRPPLRVKIFRAALPIAAALAVTAGLMGYYFWRVTGDPFRMPYEAYRATYDVAPSLLWQSPRPVPVYHHRTLYKHYVEQELPSFQEARGSLQNLAQQWLYKTAILWPLFLGYALTLPLLWMPWILKHRRMRFLLLACGLTLLVVYSEVWCFPHYASPITAAVFALVVEGMRHLRAGRCWGRERALFLVRAVPLVCFLMLFARLAIRPPDIHLNAKQAELSWCCVGPGNLDRPRILAALEALPGRHLVVVRYDETHNLVEEWVYNEADIDHARVVWAQEMKPEANAELFHYFRDRQVWLVEPDSSPVRLAPYPVPSAR